MGTDNIVKTDTFYAPVAKNTSAPSKQKLELWTAWFTSLISDRMEYQTQWSQSFKHALIKKKDLSQKRPPEKPYVFGGEANVRLVSS